ncbi:MAG: hypothetical protein CL489_10685 [Acidobacteria bacterium]|nr:hypothetical protein [Acidobacteriota bacterium]|tara:strand:- start:1574 stop:1903 length:330 start_codon:yes stop_codon:yes gene_type:complete
MANLIASALYDIHNWIKAEGYTLSKRHKTTHGRKVLTLNYDYVKGDNKVYITGDTITVINNGNRYRFDLYQYESNNNPPNPPETIFEMYMVYNDIRERVRPERIKCALI